MRTSTRNRLERLAPRPDSSHSALIAEVSRLGGIAEQVLELAEGALQRYQQGIASYLGLIESLRAIRSVARQCRE